MFHQRQPCWKRLLTKLHYHTYQAPAAAACTPHTTYCCCCVVEATGQRTHIQLQYVCCFFPCHPSTFDRYPPTIAQHSYAKITSVSYSERIFFPLPSHQFNIIVQFSVQFTQRWGRVSHLSFLPWKRERKKLKKAIWYYAFRLKSMRLLLSFNSCETYAVRNARL